MKDTKGSKLRVPYTKENMNMLMVVNSSRRQSRLGINIQMVHRPLGGGLVIKSLLFLLDVGLALISTDSPEDDVHLLETATFGLRKEPKSG